MSFQKASLLTPRISKLNYFTPGVPRKITQMSAECLAKRKFAKPSLQS